MAPLIRSLAKLEFLLGLAILSLVWQLLPADLTSRLNQALDPRSWGSHSWFLANAAVFVVLVSIRFGADLKQTWQRWLMSALKRSPRVYEMTEEERKAKLHEEQELYRRMAEARKRQVI